jgi:glutamine amidotransferase
VITIVDYGRGNIFSIAQALAHLGAPSRVTSDPAEIATADRIVLPGVGAFGDAMAKLDEHAIPPALAAAAGGGAAVLGICLGMQLLATTSSEFGAHAGLGLIPGHVRRLPDDGPVRVPNVGWRELRPGPGAGRLSSGIGRMMYFVHSYGFFADDPSDVAATIAMNGAEVPAVVRRGRIVGCQFHPEKSGADGLALLRWFLTLN